MIQPQDLRIGNWVKIDDGRDDGALFKVHGASSHNSGHVYDNEDAIYGIDQIKPIPLTGEWLKDFGFWQFDYYTIQNTWNISLERNRVLSIGNVATPNEMVFLYEVNKEHIKEVVTIRNYDYDSKMYVHQLQNLYYALTGEELTIKEK